MPFCVDCQSWYPSSAPACGRCGGALAGERPESISTIPVRATGEAWEHADSVASLPDRENEHLDLHEALALVGTFDALCLRESGRHAAPRSWLPAPRTRIATALDLVAERAEEENDWPTIRRMREAFVDLQVFLPDDEAAAAESFATQPKQPAARDGKGEAALDQVVWAQATAISILRDDERILGAHNALRGIDIVIGAAQRSLEAVDRYKESQMAGMGGLVLFPAGVVVGFAIGSLVVGITLSAILIGVGLIAAGIFVGPWFGWQVGTLSSRLDRLAMRSDSITALRIGRGLATAVGFTLYFGGPLSIGLAIAVAFERLGLP